MSDYEQLLEKQNEELRQLLATEQEKVHKLTRISGIYHTYWEESIIPTLINSTDDREGRRYTYTNTVYAYADILWDKNFKGWKVTWSNGLLLTPLASEVWESVANAKQRVEEQVNHVLEMSTRL